MDKKIAGLLGAVAALGAMSAAQATPPAQSEPLKANSFAELLDPIPNASATLQAADQQTAPSIQGNPQLAELVMRYHHHHHHHHFWRRFRHHHHHHHHFRRY